MIIRIFLQFILALNLAFQTLLLYFYPIIEGIAIVHSSILPRNKNENTFYY